MRATGGKVSWGEARAMGEYERKAFLYVAHELEGAKINWATGKMTWPTPPA